MNETEQTPAIERGVHSALWVRMEIRIEGADAVEGDTIALGAAIADLRREGWNLESVRRRYPPDASHATANAIVAVLIRDWKIDEPKTPANGYVVGKEQELVEIDNHGNVRPMAYEWQPCERYIAPDSCIRLHHHVDEPCLPCKIRFGRATAEERAEMQ